MFGDFFLADELSINSDGNNSVKTLLRPWFEHLLPTPCLFCSSKHFFCSSEHGVMMERWSREVDGHGLLISAETSIVSVVSPTLSVIVIVMTSVIHHKLEHTLFNL